MTDFGRKLSSNTIAQVRAHSPQSHTHTQAQISDLVHDALKIQTKEVDPAAIANGFVLVYRTASGKIEYEAQSGSGASYTDRGDPASHDWDKDDFTTDATWRDLDLSSIIGTGVKLVHFKCELEDDAVGSNFQIRQKGRSNTTNISILKTQVADIFIMGKFWVLCDADGFVEYKGTNLTFTWINLVVCGWIA